MQPVYATSIILVATLSGFAVSVWSETRGAEPFGPGERREIAAATAPIGPSLPWRLTLAEAAEASEESGSPVLVYVRPAPSEAKGLEQELASDPRVVERLGGFELVCADLWSSNGEAARAAGATLTALDLHTSPHLVVVETADDGAPQIVDAICPLIGPRFGAQGVSAELARVVDDPGAPAETELRAVRRLRAAGHFHVASERFGASLAAERSEVGPLHRTVALELLLSTGTTGEALEESLVDLLERESDRDVLFRGWGLVVRSMEDRMGAAHDPDKKRQTLRELRAASRKLYQAAPDDRLLPVMETVLALFQRDPDDLDSLDRIFVRNLTRRIDALDSTSPALAPR